MNAQLCLMLPDLVQHIILEFLDYRLRNKKYIRQLSRDLPVYKLILDRPCVKKYYFVPDYNSPVQIFENYDEEYDEYYYTDDLGNDSYFKVSIVTKKYGYRHYTFEDRLEISYSYNDKECYIIEKWKYQQTYVDYWQKISEIHEDIYRN